jgi:NAD(P)-dependent dehydrogenase (short-subunit alcohol dehydrogenase family)
MTNDAVHTPALDFLDGQVVAITGGARGLGRAIAERLARAGATVVLLDRNGEAAAGAAHELSASGLSVLSHELDVTSEADVQAVFGQLVATHGRLDVLVNNAGIYRLVPFLDVTYEEWSRVLRTNLDGVFLCSRAAFPAMRDRGYGRIVNIASDVVYLGIPDFAPYTASKAGVIGLTRVLANVGGPHGITANAIAPGLTETEGVAEATAHLIPLVVEEQAVKRPGRPIDIAECVAYLVGENSGFITGQTVVVNGGTRFV